MISTKLNIIRHFSGLELTIASCKIESIKPNKKELLADLCKENSCNILCVHETYRSETINILKSMG
jgi:hypothetical protein